MQNNRNLVQIYSDTIPQTQADIKYLLPEIISSTCSAALPPGDSICSVFICPAELILNALETESLGPLMIHTGRAGSLAPITHYRN